MRFVLVHGGFHGAWCWSRVIPELEALGHEAIAVDLPGHGERRDEDSTLQNRPHAIIEVMRCGDVLVGHSGGGYDITLAADQVPDLVGHLIYLAAALPPHLMQRLQDHFTCHDATALSEAALAAVAPSIRGIASKGETKVSREYIARFPALEIISVFGVGYDGVDAVAARERGIEVTNTPDVLTDDVADFAMTLLLSTARRVVMCSYTIDSAGNRSVTGASTVSMKCVSRSNTSTSGSGDSPCTSSLMPSFSMRSRTP